MDSTAQRAPAASEIITENASIGDAWIRQRKQPYGLRNLQQNCFHGWRMDSTDQTAPAASEIFNETASTGDAWIRQRKQPMWLQKSSSKVLPRVTHGFDSAKSPCGL
jgi:hypothetical protein